MSNTEFTAMGRQEREQSYTNLMNNYKKEICNLHDKQNKLLEEIEELEKNIKYLLGAIVIIIFATVFVLIGTI
jgi:archaellum component FlaC